MSAELVEEVKARQAYYAQLSEQEAAAQTRLGARAEYRASIRQQQELAATATRKAWVDQRDVLREQLRVAQIALSRLAQPPDLSSEAAAIESARVQSLTNGAGRLVRTPRSA